MDNESAEQSIDLLDLLRNQADVFLEAIARPAVQLQIAAVAFILLLVWLLPGAVRRWRKRQSAQETAAPEGGVDRAEWRTIIYKLLTPILVLLGLIIAISLFASLGWPNGLLQEVTNLIWIWIFYRVLATLLYARFGDAAKPYRNRIVTPVFLVFVLTRLVSVIPGSVALAEASFGVGNLTITLGSLGTAIVILYIFFVLAWIVRQSMVQILSSRLDTDPGIIRSAATLTRYALISLGILFALGAMGLNFTSLAIVAGGLSVGIGIGLQDLVANFVSGLVLLFEQSLRPGDVIELNGRISEVEKISLRATTIRTRTNEEIIVPNSSFTTAQVTNLTKSERKVLATVPIGVSYNSDPKFVRDLAVNTALQHGMVLKVPSPTLLFMGYGESSLDFNLVVSIRQPELMIVIRSDLYYMLWRVFSENGIEIPFPQRDLHLRDGWGELATNPQQG